jgi:hypothetical protein
LAAGDVFVAATVISGRLTARGGIVMRVNRCVALGVAAWAAMGTVRGATLVPDPNFGGGDGWRAPYETLAGDTAAAVVPDPVDSTPRYLYLGEARTGTSTAQVNAGNLERGLAYNAATGHLLLVSRNGLLGATPGIRILDAATGVDLGELNQGAGVISGGTFALNMIGVADDGAIYLANLTTNTATTPYKVYRWANEAATPTLAYSGQPDTLLSGARLGDTFDVIGSGASTRLIAGYSNAPAVAGNNGVSLFTTNDGLSYTATTLAMAADTGQAVPAAGEFRLGLTFADSDTFMGKSVINPVQVADISGSTATVTASFSTDGIELRPMDFAIVNGKPLLAVVEASSSQAEAARARLFVYDMTDPSLPLAERQIGVATALSPFTPGGPNQFVNGNGTGQVKFGAINDNVATIYAMSTNNGIEAFTLTLDLAPEEDANFNGDAAVDGVDFMIWQANYGTEDVATLATGDANGDGDVNDGDFAVWTDQFGTTGLASAAGASVPEPAAGVLALIALAGLVRLHRGEN